jgi:hypothetical protein
MTQKDFAFHSRTSKEIQQIAVFNRMPKNS